jgi:hypothetical protein
MFPDVQMAVQDLAVGSHSEVVPMPMDFLPGNYMILKMLERKEPRQMTFDEVSAQLSDKALQFEQDRAFGEWLVEKMEEYEVEIYPGGLEHIKFHKLGEE